MHIEIESAVKFLVNELSRRLGTLPEETVETLKTRLTELLACRFENHWYPEKPLKGCAYRCINISIDDGSVDSVLLEAGEEIGFSKSALMSVFNKGLALWIDPNDVSCRLGKGAIFPIFRKIADQNSASPISYTPVNSQRRPQRPRSISPPLTTTQKFNSYNQQQRPRSTTPPGFSSSDAGQMYQHQTIERKNHSLENLHKLWDTIPNTTSYTPSSTYMPPLTPTTKSTTSRGYGGQKRNDTVYSFNQYSSYYNSSSMKKKYGNTNNPTYHKQQPKTTSWQDDETYNKYHWSRNNRTASSINTFSTNSLSYNGYSLNRHAQEVC